MLPVVWKMEVLLHSAQWSYPTGRSQISIIPVLIRQQLRSLKRWLNSFSGRYLERTSCGPKLDILHDSPINRGGPHILWGWTPIDSWILWAIQDFNVGFCNGHKILIWIIFWCEFQRTAPYLYMCYTHGHKSHSWYMCVRVQVHVD